MLCILDEDKTNFWRSRPILQTLLAKRSLKKMKQTLRHQVVEAQSQRIEVIGWLAFHIPDSNPIFILKTWGHYEVTQNHWVNKDGINA